MFPDELLKSAGVGCGPGRGLLPDLTLRERPFGVGKHLDDALLFGGFRLRHGFVRHRPPEAQGRALSVIGELDLDVVEAGGGAVLDGHDDLLVASVQVEVAVAPGMELGRAAEGLTRSRGAALAGVMDQQDGGLDAALEVAQEAEDGGDIRDSVLVDAVEADQGVEDQEARPDARHGVLQALAVVAVVETQDGHVDDGDVEGLEVGAGGPGDKRHRGLLSPN